MEALNLFSFEALISQMLVMWWRLILRLVDISVKYRPVRNPGPAWNMPTLQGTTSNTYPISGKGKTSTQECQTGKGNMLVPTFFSHPFNPSSTNPTPTKHHNQRQNQDATPSLMLHSPCILPVLKAQATIIRRPICCSHPSPQHEQPHFLGVEVNWCHGVQVDRFILTSEKMQGGGGDSQWVFINPS